MKLIESEEGKKSGAHVVRIKKIQKLGRGFEGIVYRAVAYLSGKKKETKIPVTVKEFDPLVFKQEGTWGHPNEQLRQIKRLISLNKKKKLRLRIVSNIGLLGKSGKKPALITDYLPKVRLSEKQELEFHSDSLRQQRILKKFGFGDYPDIFFPQIDPKTNKGIAVINDFGHIKGTTPMFSPQDPFSRKILNALSKLKDLFFQNK